MDVRWQRMLSSILKEQNDAEDCPWLSPACSTWIPSRADQWSGLLQPLGNKRSRPVSMPLQSLMWK